PTQGLHIVVSEDPVPVLVDDRQSHQLGPDVLRVQPGAALAALLDDAGLKAVPLSAGEGPDTNNAAPFRDGDVLIGQILRLQNGLTGQQFAHASSPPRRVSYSPDASMSISASSGMKVMVI